MGRTRTIMGAGLAALLLSSTVMATAAGTAAAAGTTPSYVQTGASVLEYQPLKVGDISLGLGVPLPVLSIHVRISRSPAPTIFGNGGITFQTFTVSVKGVTVCTVVTDTRGQGSCTLSLQNQLDALLGAPVVVSYAGNVVYAPSAASVPIIGPALLPDLPPFPI